MYEIEHYISRSGRVPVEEFLNSLPVKLREKTVRSLMLLAEYGPALEGAESKYVRDGVFELRTKFGTDITRVFYFFYSGKRIIVTSSFSQEISEDAKGRDC